MEHWKFNRIQGWGLSCYRVKMVGNYTEVKNLTVILVIETEDHRVTDENKEVLPFPGGG